MAILYRSSRLYHTLMAVVYGSHRRERFQSVARWVSDGADVLDVCCGDGALADYLPASGSYRGLDQSPDFVQTARQRGRQVEGFDLRRNSLPSAQIVVCQVSLFQFHPDEETVLAKLFEAARERLIISESVLSLTQSRWSWLASFVGWGTHAQGMTDTRFRFTPESLRRLFQSYGPHIRHSSSVCGGRDWVYVLDKVREPC